MLFRQANVILNMSLSSITLVILTDRRKLDGRQSIMIGAEETLSLTFMQCLGKEHKLVKPGQFLAN